MAQKAMPRWSLEEEPEATTPAPKIPRAAFIGGLSALAFTTGVTIAMIPALRRNRQRSLGTAKQATDYALGTRPVVMPSNLSSTAAGSVHTLAMIDSPSPPTRVTPPSAPQPTLLSQIRAPPTPQPITGPGVTRYTGPESILYTPGDEDHPSHTSTEGEGEIDPEAAISPLFALKAFAIASALVGGTAVVGAWAIGKSMGVSDMDEFTQNLRERTNTSLPTLTSNIYRDPPSPTAAQMAKQEAFEAVPGRRSEDDEVVGEWATWLGGEVEKERREILAGRKEGRWGA